MAYQDYKDIHRNRKRWLKEQQLIRKKYQISYNMTYISTSSFNKAISNHKKTTEADEQFQSKYFQLEKSSINNPPMYCLKCYLHLTKCSCKNGLGYWWLNLKEQVDSTNRISKQYSKTSLHERHVNFDSDTIDFTSTDQMNTSQVNYVEEQYVLLKWNDQQSLLNFLRTTKHKKSLSSMTIEQLQKLIINNEHIHIFNSINTLILSLNKLHSQHKTIYSIYIDPTCYSTIQGIIPWSQSYLIADNINLTRTTHSIQHISQSLGINIDQTINKFSQKSTSKKQWKSILNEQALLIASQIPYSTFHPTTSHT
ncbi:hypothetical protein I4U23_028719 [Adineta vaga]|nr:hypothetical protein I4U23_028719 [Adineta vaga]